MGFIGGDVDVGPEKGINQSPDKIGDISELTGLYEITVVTCWYMFHFHWHSIRRGKDSWKPAIQRQDNLS